MSITSDTVQTAPVSTNILIRYSIREFTAVLLSSILLFGFAGTIQWWPAWAVTGILTAWSVLTLLVILRTNPSLLEYRLRRNKNAKKWDIIILSIVGITNVAKFAIAGLDYRYGWPGGFSVDVQALGLLASLAGYGLVIWATASNAFFSQVVQIQTERNHRVTSEGPYGWIRHPGYLGVILFELALPLVLDSPWAFNIGLFNAFLFIVRTSMEDKTLQAELEGYEKYTHQVKHRLFPGIW